MRGRGGGQRWSGLQGLLGVPSNPPNSEVKLIGFQGGRGWGTDQHTGFAVNCSGSGIKTQESTRLSQ